MPQMPGPGVQVASTQPGAGVQEAAQAAQQAQQTQAQPQPQPAPDWHDKLAKGGFGELTSIIQDPNASDEVKSEAKDRLFNLMNDQRLETKAKDRKSTRLNSSHSQQSRMPSSA